MTLFRPVKKGTTDVSTIIQIIDSTAGTPEQAVEHNTEGIALWYRRDGATVTAITEAALASADAAHSDGGIEHLDDGVYRLDLPDAACATGVNGVTVGGTVTGMIVIPTYIPLVDYDPYDTVRMGMTALPNAAADAAGGLPISDDGGLDIDEILARIGTPVALDGAAATLGGMLTKLADDNGGADFDAQTDSLEKIRGDLASTSDISVQIQTDMAADPTDFPVRVNEIADNAITPASIAGDAITSAKIADDAIAAEHLADGAITAASIAANAIGASELATDAVTEIVNAIVGATIEGAYDLGDMLRLIASGVFCSTEDGGLSFRNIANTKDRFNVVIDSSNRTIIIADAT